MRAVVVAVVVAVEECFAHQMADAVEGVVGHGEGDPELGKADQEGSDRQGVDQVQVVRVAPGQHQSSQGKGRDG